MVARTLMGRRNDGSYGLDVSLPGYDVLTATEDQMAFTSRWGHAGVIHAQGVTQRATTVSFPALPYIPMCMAWPIDQNRFRIQNLCFANYTYNELNVPVDVHVDPCFLVTSSTIRIMDGASAYYQNPPGYTTGIEMPVNHVYRYVVLRMPGGV